VDEQFIDQVKNIIIGSFWDGDGEKYPDFLRASSPARRLVIRWYNPRKAYDDPENNQIFMVIKQRGDRHYMIMRVDPWSDKFRFFAHCDRPKDILKIIELLWLAHKGQ
jgi:hypothetical protein